MDIYRGDLKPDLVITLTDDDTPIDLTTAESIRVIGVKNGEELFDRAPESADDEGVVTMLWEPEDTATVGRVFIEVEVTWPDNKPQTFQPGEAVDIHPDLG